jgi:hypothetical protein
MSSRSRKGKIKDYKGLVHSLTLAGVALSAIALVSSSVYATLTATAFNTSPITAVSETLILTQGSAGASGGIESNISAMAPGDIVYRFLDLTNSGTMAGTSLTLQVIDGLASSLSTNATNGLQITLHECSVAWTQAGATCSGSTTSVLSSTSLNSLATATSISVSSLSASSVSRLRISIALPVSSEVTTNGVLPVGTIQGESSELTWTFQESQRNATTSSS